jgi:pimeloyl-ACP methyl ester carboxylesterase
LLRHKAIKKNDSSDWVVFLHGIGGGSSIWFKQLREYKEHFNLLLIDLPGHGGSEKGLKDLKEYSFEVIAKQILAVLDHQGISKAHFVGISLGTIIIQVLHQLSPIRVKSMVLGGAVEAFNWLAKTIIHVAQPIKSFVPYMWLYKLSAWILMPRKDHIESRRAFVKEAYKLGKREFLCWFKLHQDVEPFFKRVRKYSFQTPTLYIMGDQDHMFLSTIQKKVKILKHALLEVVHKSGHVVNIDQYQEFNQRSLRFLLSLSSSPKESI